MKNTVQKDGFVIIKKRVISTVLLIAMVFGIVGSAEAGGIFDIKEIQSGTAIENDVFLTGEKPTLNEDVNGNVYAFGPEVVINGDIDGSLFVIGNQVNLQGNVTGSVYALAVTFQQMEESGITQSLYTLAVDLRTQKGSSIGRDVWAVALSAVLRGAIGRNLNAVLGLFEIYKLLRDNFNFTITGLTFAPIQQTDNNPSLSLNLVARPHLHRAFMHGPFGDITTDRIVPQAENDPAALILPQLQAFLTFLVIGWLMIWWKPALFQRWVDMVRNKPLASMGYGLVVLINGYIIFILLLVLVVSLVIALYFFKLPILGSIVLGGGLSGLGLAFATFLMCTIYLSKAIVAFLAGFLILSKLWPGVLKYKVLPLLLGLILYVLIAAIPYIGWITGFLVTLLGLGAIWLVWRVKTLPDDFDFSQINPISKGVTP